MKKDTLLWLVVGGFVLLALAGGTVATSSNNPDALVQRVAEAIASAEGFFVSGSRPQRNNNPGDISAGGTVLTYDTPEDGWAALYHQVSLMFQGPPASHFSPDMTISQVAQIYAEDWQNWANNVAGYLGVTTDTKLSDLQA